MKKKFFIWSSFLEYTHLKYYLYQGQIGLFYIILCKQMKYFGTDNKILTPYTTPHIIYVGGIRNVKMG